MGTYSPVELVLKTRKPYTITKQRERWTDEEHNRFLEALKLYGRAWQRIEEHIGTKTAVQIRSHAQKFFSKLEKEALGKGIPVGEAIDIEIPPPRPKKKPSKPYPRKTGAIGVPTTQAGVNHGKQVTSCSSHPSKHVLDLEKEPLPEKSVDDGGTNIETRNDDCYHSTVCLEASSLASPVNKGLLQAKEDAKGSCNSMEVAPFVKQVANEDKSTKHHVSNESNGSHKSNEAIAVDVLHNNGKDDEMQGSKKFPRHDPVHILDGSLKICSQGPSSIASYQESAFQQIGGLYAPPALCTNPAVSPTLESQISTSRPTNHQKFTTFNPPLTPFHISQEEYCSLLQMSPTSSSLLVSALLQNPTTCAAAHFAATFWPYTSAETSTDSHPGAIGAFPPRPVSLAPSMAAIAATTVAAATSWWAAHGLLPLCAPYHVTHCPASVAASPSHNIGQPAPVHEEKEENNIVQNSSSQGQKLDKDFFEGLQVQNSASKSPTTLFLGSGGSSDPKNSNGLTSAEQDNKTSPAETEQKDSSKNTNRKQVDRSSCGSNSSSDVHTGALDKHDKSREEARGPDASDAAGDFCSHLNRNYITSTDSRKEVPEKGRMAFKAFFLREVLLQSFSPPRDVRNKEQPHKQGNLAETRQNTDESNNRASQFDLNRNSTESCSSLHEPRKNGLAEDEKAKEGLLTIEVAQEKQKAQKTGFKPYKRCSVEATECRVASSCIQDQEKSPKRFCLGEEVSNLRS